MAEKKLVDELFHRLTDPALEGLQRALQACAIRHQANVRLGHWMKGLLQLDDSDLHRVIKHFNISSTAVESEIAGFVGNLRSDSQSKPRISTELRTLISEAWLQASVGQNDQKIRTGHILLAALRNDELNDVLLEVSPSLAQMSGDELSASFEIVTAGSPESVRGLQATGSPEPDLPILSSSPIPPATRRESALAQFTEDLTEKARQGKLDPVTGRDAEVRRIIRILLKRDHNNPILTGDAGVGKTAVVEAFAICVAADEVPPPLKAVSVRILDINALSAGASVRGEFENRLKALIDEVKTAGNVILFIDEVHNLVGAGGAAGQGDAANILKPALARGQLRTIAATTADEYRKFIEEDPALKRRFEEISVSEPSEEIAIQMLRPLVAGLEKHNSGVLVFHGALAAAVRLSNRYMPSRRLPDKAVSVLKTACAAVQASQSTTPPLLEDARRAIDALTAEIEMLEKEQSLGLNHSLRITTLQQEKCRAQAQWEFLHAWFERELPTIQKIAGLRHQLKSGTSSMEDTQRHQLQDDLHSSENELVKIRKIAQALEADGFSIGKSGRERWQDAFNDSKIDLSKIQEADPLVLSAVDESSIAAIISEETGIPVGRLAKDDIKATLNLKETLNRRVVGQDFALEAIEREIRNAEARLKEPNKPIGAFLLAGPSGTGKTETALALAEARYGSERNLIVFNMNEFKEEHTVSTLLGAPPGYVGYQKGGQLTEAIRRRPYSVVLLDELEKAHNSIQEVFLQVLDQGWTKDRDGRFIDFRNAILLFTTNAASDEIVELCQDRKSLSEPGALVRDLKEALREYFSDPLLGRLTIVPYAPLDAATLENIISIKLGRTRQRLADNHSIELAWDKEVLKHISERCAQAATGARMVDAYINSTIVSEVSRITLTNMLEDKKIDVIRIGTANTELTYGQE